MNRKLNTFLKGFISIVIICYLIFKIDWMSAYDSLCQANYWLFSATIGLSLFGMVISSYKWQILLRVVGIKERFKNLFIFYYIGRFFNGFLPTTVGGDIYRIIMVSRQTRNVSGATLATFLERLTGIIVMLFYGLVIGLTTLSITPDPTINYLVIIISIAVFVLTFLIFQPFFARWGVWFFKKIRLNKLAGFIDKIYQSWKLFRSAQRPMSAALLISFLHHGTVFLAYYIFSLSLGLDTPFWVYCIVVPSLTIIAMIPVSLDGYGLKEGSTVFLLSLYGVSDSAGISIAILARLLGLIISISGGFVYMFSPSRAKVDFSKQHLP